jgi:hypothetical protein
MNITPGPSGVSDEERFFVIIRYQYRPECVDVFINPCSEPVRELHSSQPRLTRGCNNSLAVTRLTSKSCNSWPVLLVSADMTHCALVFLIVVPSRKAFST